MPTDHLSKILDIVKAGEAGVPLLDSEATLFLPLRPGTLSIWRHEKRGPKYVLIGTSPRYMLSDLRAYMPEDKPQKQVSLNVGRHAKSCDCANCEAKRKKPKRRRPVAAERAR